MQPVEFTIELGEKPTLAIPDEVAAQLPKKGRARIIILPEADAEDADWQQGAYEQFVRDDAGEDSIYDSFK